MTWFPQLFLAFLLISRISSGETPLQQHSTSSYHHLAAYIDNTTLVLLGEASHGTSEYYSHRARISRKLIESGRYAFVAVEGDWSLFTALNSWVKLHADAPESLDEAMAQLNRWPYWMWRNQEFKDFAEWLRRHNESLPAEERVGIYGMDLYAKQQAMINVTDWLKEFYPNDAPGAEAAYRCLSRFTDIRSYLQRVASTGDHCGEEVSNVLNLVQQLTNSNAEVASHKYLYAEMNALMVQQAELHYRANLIQGPQAWNVRASFFYQVAERLLMHYNGAGETYEKGGIIWAHNTHIGDARATDMGNAGMLNIGQLAREQLGADHVFAVGFSTYEGKVLAASAWENPVQLMPVSRARQDSWEYKLASSHEGDFYIIFGESDSPPGRSALPHRAIGVTFNPTMANQQNYPISIPAQRYDAFVFIRNTTALNALD
ncbi:MAG: erythromycin esterase family protein [Bacteroidetes bacterium]|nr:erythromycin esterase family protein [Bacteroidota bacterium]MCH8523372.1 erythromycin esterase family protein [Balneolales bacterium]